MKQGEIEREIEKIRKRNKHVEADKAWETSWTRRALIFSLTYLAIVVYFFAANLPKPFVNSFVPALAFVISMLGLHCFKGPWEKYFYKKKQ